MIKWTLFHMLVLLPPILAHCEIHRNPVYGRPYIDEIESPIAEFEELKLKAARLEFILEENIISINTKSMHVAEKEKLIEDMTHNIQLLQKAVVDNKNMQIESSYPNGRSNELETEVGILLDATRKNNHTLCILQSQVRDAEEKSDQMALQVEKMESIVTEQWIQIRQLEQALQITEMRTLKAQRKIESSRCILLKTCLEVEILHGIIAPGLMVGKQNAIIVGSIQFIKKISGCNHQNIFSMLESRTFSKEFLKSYMIQASNQLKRIISTAQKYHYQLQALVKQVMEKNEFTAAVANKEIVFWVASALITFPAMGAWMLYSTCFS